MQPGWNLGNTYDAIPDETSWGNPPVTRALLKKVRSQGFKSIRLPVTWGVHQGAAPDYTIDPAWTAKVRQVALLDQRMVVAAADRRVGGPRVSRPPFQRMVVPSGWSNRPSSSCVGRPSQSPRVATAKAAVVTARCRRARTSAPVSSPDR